MSNTIEFTPINTGITLKIPVYRQLKARDHQFKKGDVIKIRPFGSWPEFFHVHDVHPNGNLDVIRDKDGVMCGLSGEHSGVEPATLYELVEDRERRKKKA